MIVDPLAKLNINVQNYDVKRRASVYYDMGGTMCWTKAWFNDRERGERSVAIPLHLALQFAHDEISLDEWLARFYPKQMSVYQKVMTEARKQLLGI
uniref:hypothetical protein n=1 Tax=Prevotella sp. TaxID=59823 RepID=UPI0040268A60